MTTKLTIEQTLEAHGFVMHRVQGISMLPLLHEETDLVHLVPVSEPLKKYDMVLYRTEQKGLYILHRIISIRKHYYIICGDNNRASEKVSKDRVVAVAKGYYQSGKYIPCDDPDYLHYVQERCRSITDRKIYRKQVKLSGEQTLLLKMLRCSVLDLPFEETVRDIDWQILFELAKHQEIAAMIYPCVKQADCPQDILTAWKQISDWTLRKEILFDAERNAVLTALAEHKVAYIPLKGIVTKNLYPRKGMREFCDNDILIEENKSTIVTSVMAARGYTCHVDEHCHHDCYTKKPFFTFEMHRILFPKKHRLYPYFSDIRKRAIPSGDTAYSYQMCDEDLYFHILAHFYKHYTNAGTGIRPLADLFLLKRKLITDGTADFDQIRKLLHRAGLTEFEDMVSKLTQEIFGEESIIIDAEQLQYLFDSGLRGKLQNHFDHEIAKKGRLHYILSRLFAPTHIMKARFPILKKLPFLLPFFWVVRLFKFMRKDGKRKIIELQALKNATNNTEKN